jgi:hypothetical protein
MGSPLIEMAMLTIFIIIFHHTTAYGERKRGRKCLTVLPRYDWITYTAIDFLQLFGSIIVI